MPSHADAIRRLLYAGPTRPARLAERAGISQPTLSRTLKAMGSDILRIGAGKSIQYALRDARHGLSSLPVYRVSPDGRIQAIGQLAPVHPEGFVMQDTDGRSAHSDDLPWWLYDMRPQGYLGRAWASRHAASLDLPPALKDWRNHHILRALAGHGEDLSGNLLLGERSLARFLAAPTPVPIAESEKPAAYARLAQQAANGDLPGSPAGGEQPKFTAYAMTDAGAQHVIVKFSEAEAGPVGERWRDLLLAEFLALASLRNAGMAAAHAHVVDNLNTPARQRFLEIRRFDRFGARGRLGLHSLTALALEFVGKGNAGWPEITRELARQGRIDADSAHQAARLWAFGHLIGNTDMHGGNLSFLSHTDRPYTLAPAYDMTPMAFAPRSGGGLPEALPPAVIRADIAPECWHRALAMAQIFLRALGAESRFSPRFAPCIAALGEHIETAARQIGRLAG